MKSAIDMTKGNPLGLIVRFSLPILIGYLFQQIYTLADRIIVGQFVGAEAFSAVGATSAVTALFMSLCMGSSMGIEVVVAQFHGADDKKNTAAAITNGVYINAIVTIEMSVIAVILTTPILKALHTPQALMADASLYMKIYMGGLIAVSAYYVPFSVLQALGDAKTPLFFLIFCSVLNIVLDLIFVVPLHMGVAGAAAATVLAQVIAATGCIWYSISHIPIVKLAWKCRRLQKNLMIKILKIGLPTGIQYSLVYLAGIILQRVVNGFGTNVIGAFTATTQMETLVEQVYTAIGAAMVAYTGQNIGAGKMERISEGLKAALVISTIFSAAMTILFLLQGNVIMSIFVSDKGIIQIAAVGIRITSVFFVSMGVVRIIRYLFSGAGDSMYALQNGIIEVLSRIILVVVLTKIAFIGKWGIWITTGATWTITAIFAIFRYRSGKWKNKSVS